MAQRDGGRFSGRQSLFSTLNIEAARLVRFGDEARARLYAQAASALEAELEHEFSRHKDGFRIPA